MANRKESLRIEKASRAYSNIPDMTVREFRTFLELEQIYPGADISYESASFIAKNDDGKEEETKPDLKVIRQPDNKKIFIEITKEKRNGKDPKGRERRIMRKAAPDCAYVVLYNDSLKRIQVKYKGYNFFKKENKRRVSKESSPEMKPKFIRMNPMIPSKPTGTSAH